MPSRLSSLLVRDGLVGVKRMEKAFQRQVIYGGALDTILLEIASVPEERLTQYLALASGLPPAARDESRRIDPAAVALLPDELAQQFRAVPLSISQNVLRVLVCAPLELTELEDLADLLDRPLQPLITPEYRWHVAFAAAYGTEVPTRFATLGRTLEIDSSPEPVGRTKSVIIANDVGPNAFDERSLSPAATQPLVPMPPRLPAKPSTPPSAAALTITTSFVPTPVAADAPTARIATAATLATEPASRLQQKLGDMHARGEAVSAFQPAVESSGVPLPVDDQHRRTPSTPIATAGRDTPLAIVPARELLAAAEDRDTVFLTLLRATRARARYAGLLTVQGGAAIGRVALAEPGIDTAGIASILIPLDVVSPFRAVVTHQQPHIGSLAASDVGIDLMMARLGGAVPPSALLMPIVLRNRVVAIVVAHRGHSELKLLDIAELLPLASAAADALGRLIVKHKRAATDGTPSGDADAGDTQRMQRATDEPSEVHLVTAPMQHIDDVLDEIEQSREGDAEDAIAEALARPVETIARLAQRFPGMLRMDRFAVTGRPLRAAQYGGLLDLAVRIGSAATELLIEQMRAAARDVRFYATVCAGELRPASAVFALVERLFDQDYGVRDAAIEALAGYPLQELTHSMARARRAVHSTDSEVVAAATSAIVALGDIEAIGDLIGSIERAEKGSEKAIEHVRRALVALTAQDLGTSEKKWRKWWESARKRHRVEWLIEGLSHKDDAIRETSIQDLRRLTGEYFGYHHDLPRKERDAAAERWNVWWREIGQRRFTAPD